METLLSAYRGLRLSVSPGDQDLVFAAAFLSRNTDYYANVVRWVRLLSPDGELDPSLAVNAGRSFQLRQLPEVMASLREISPLPRDPWEARRRLLSLRWVGPKVADAFLLFTGVSTELAPADVHFLRLGVRLGLLSAETRAQQGSVPEMGLLRVPQAGGVRDRSLEGGARAPGGLGPDRSVRARQAVLL